MLIASYSILALIVLLGALLAINAKNLVAAAIVLGISSAALAMMLLILEAPYAAGFELSVGAGLVSVLFIVVISLATPGKIPTQVESPADDKIDNADS